MGAFGHEVETKMGDHLGEIGTGVHSVHLSHPFWGWSCSNEKGVKDEHSHVEMALFCYDEADVWMHVLIGILRSVNQSCTLWTVVPGS